MASTGAVLWPPSSSLWMAQHAAGRQVEQGLKHPREPQKLRTNFSWGNPMMLPPALNHNGPLTRPKT